MNWHKGQACASGGGLIKTHSKSQRMLKFYGGKKKCCIFVPEYSVFFTVFLL
ncbi:hypothetical protein HMPREF9075_02463 [Capnocytophaga sp. oral taxon 332 str. F0381]|nr:hypothetical protein HMPREF9075_02463 [Capnocytophaga sp. oral taxon 332 str. F0381]